MPRKQSGNFYRQQRAARDEEYENAFGGQSVLNYFKKPRIDNTSDPDVADVNSSSNVGSEMENISNEICENEEIPSENFSETNPNGFHCPENLNERSNDNELDMEIDVDEGEVSSQIPNNVESVTVEGPLSIPNVESNTAEILPEVPNVESNTAEILPEVPNVDSNTAEILPEVPNVDSNTAEILPEVPNIGSDTVEAPSEVRIAIVTNENVVNSHNSSTATEKQNPFANFLENRDLGYLPVDVNFGKFEISDQIRDLITNTDTSSFQHANGPFTQHNSRSLNANWFFKTIGNSGKIVTRTWMMYSPVKNSVYCLPCIFFSKVLPYSSLEKPEGFKHFNHRERMSEHENSKNHRICFTQWKEMEFRAKNRISTIDQQLQQQIVSEALRWREVLSRMINCIKYLAVHNLSLRGHREKLANPHENHGNLLDLLKLVAEYDDVLRKHLEHALSHPGTVSYLSPLIQNELLKCMAKVVRTNIIRKIKKAKYFGLLLDSTPDVARHEQMSLVIRFVHINDNNEAEIREAFLGFFILKKKDAESIAQATYDELETHDLPFEDCRSFCSDNANVMAGNINGLQAIFKRRNDLSTFMNCNNHTLNLAGVHAVSEETVMGLFFSILDSLYNYFSKSTLRWDRLKSILAITLKRECETRWSSRKDAVQVVFLHLRDIISLLDDMSNDPNENRATRTDALALHERIKTYDFVFLCKFWHDVLSPIDVVQKKLQNPHLIFKEAALDIQSLYTHFTTKREEIVELCLDSGKSACNEFGVSMEKRKRNGSLTPIQEMERVMKASLDTLAEEMQTRFKRLNDLDEKFGFLLDVQNICYGKDDEIQLKAKCDQFGKDYSIDVNGQELFSEIADLRMLLENRPNAIKTVFDVFKFIFSYKDESLLPNLQISLQILSTIPISIASCERSFSKLKLILTYLRSTMDPDRLSDLSFLSIEKEELQKADFNEMIDEFANMKARRINF